jgi:hypothetical protein
VNKGFAKIVQINRSAYGIYLHNQLPFINIQNSFAVGFAHLEGVKQYQYGSSGKDAENRTPRRLSINHNTAALHRIKAFEHYTSHIAEKCHAQIKRKVEHTDCFAHHNAAVGFAQKRDQDAG